MMYAISTHGFMLYDYVDATNVNSTTHIFK